MLLTMELFVCLCVGLAGSSGRNCIFSPQGGRSSVMSVSSGYFRAVAFVGSLINFLQKSGHQKVSTRKICFIS